MPDNRRQEQGVQQTEAVLQGLKFLGGLIGRGAKAVGKEAVQGNISITPDPFENLSNLIDLQGQVQKQRESSLDSKIRERHMNKVLDNVADLRASQIVEAESEGASPRDTMSQLMEMTGISTQTVSSGVESVTPALESELLSPETEQEDLNSALAGGKSNLLLDIFRAGTAGFREAVTGISAEDRALKKQELAGEKPLQLGERQKLMIQAFNNERIERIKASLKVDEESAGLEAFVGSFDELLASGADTLLGEGHLFNALGIGLSNAPFLGAAFKQPRIRNQIAGNSFLFDYGREILGQTGRGFVGEEQERVINDVIKPLRVGSSKAERSGAIQGIIQALNKKLSAKGLKVVTNDADEILNHIKSGGSIKDFIAQAGRKGGKLMIDKNGNRAIVFEDGSVQEVN